MSPRLPRWARPLLGAAVLGVLVWRLGGDPFLDGLSMVDGRSLLAALAVGLVTTLCCAWRWTLVADGLGAALPLRTAVVAYYLSQFLNTTLPGGVLGDVDRGVRHGRLAGDTGRGLRAVAWERTAGQAVQGSLVVVVLLLVPSPVRSSVPALATVAVAGVLVLVVLGRALPHAGPSLAARTLRTISEDLREGVLSLRTWPGIVAASGTAVAGHALTFLIAARTAGASAPAAELLPLALVVLLAAGLPANVAGWGPREGAAAWAFAATGLGASQGVAAAVVYGVMVVVASLPGAAVLGARWLRSG